MASQQLYSYLGRAGLWRNVSIKLEQDGIQLAPCDARALKDLCAGVTWMQRIPPALLASYRALYVVLRGDAAAAQDEINRDILRTVRGTTGLLLDLSSEDSRNDFAGSINRVLNALAHVDDMGYCQGQNYVVDVMMKAGLPERETFCLFLYLLRQGHFHGIYRKEVAMLAGYMDKLEEHLKVRLPDLSAHFEAEHYPPPLYALEWITTFFGLAAQPLVSLVALDLFLAGARNPVMRLCVSLLGDMEKHLLGLDQEGLLRDFRSRAVDVDAEGVIVRMLRDGGSRGGGSGSQNGSETAAAAAMKGGRAAEGSEEEDKARLGWSTGPDYLLILRSRHCQTSGLVELREEAKNGLLVENSSLQDALLAVSRSLGWNSLRSCWLENCLAARSDHERYTLANESLRFVIANGGHAKAAAFMLGVGGADANGVDSRLLSPLHLVALFNRPDIARVLLMSGASPELVGGVTREAAVRGGKLWSPLEMAEEACTEGGALDDAGLAVGPATLFVLQGQVCLQCNLRSPQVDPCGTCALTFCKSCQRDHFCVGKLNLPRGVAEVIGSGGADSGGSDGAGGGAGGSCRGVGGGGGDDGARMGARRFFGGGARSKGGSAVVGGGGAGGDGDGEEPKKNTRWELGSAIGDNWETLFHEGNTNARGGAARGAANRWGTGDGWKPGGLRQRSEPVTPRAAGAEEDSAASGGESPATLSPSPSWATMPSVLLGTWDKRPQPSNYFDRDRLFDNSAAFVRACFPAQTWLQYHMEEEMGLSLSRGRFGDGWGGPLKGLGMRGEYFNPEIMRSASSKEIDRHMSWVIAESGVPWESDDSSWCCPECFLLYSLSVFRHQCRGCGLVYCSAHAPPTPVPPGDRSLKLCWSCVLEGAVPLPDSLLDDDDDELEDQKPGPSANAACPPSPPPPPPQNQQQQRDIPGDGRGLRKGHKKEGSGGFLSALASLIDVVTSPTSPMPGPRGGGAAGGSGKKKPATPQRTRAPSPAANRAPVTPRGEAGDFSEEEGGEWRAGWPASITPPPEVQSPKGVSSPLLLRKEYDRGAEERTKLLVVAGPSTGSGDILPLRGNGGGEGGAGGGDPAVEQGVLVNSVRVLTDNKPAELEFPSERSWAHDFGR